MKIICVDNYDDETKDDILIAENVHSGFGETVVKILNNASEFGDSYYFKLVEDNYKLYQFEI